MRFCTFKFLIKRKIRTCNVLLTFNATFPFHQISANIRIKTIDGNRKTALHRRSNFDRNALQILEVSLQFLFFVSRQPSRRVSRLRNPSVFHSVAERFSQRVRFGGTARSIIHISSGTEIRLVRILAARKGRKYAIILSERFSGKWTNLLAVRRVIRRSNTADEAQPYLMFNILLTGCVYRER